MKTYSPRESEIERSWYVIDASGQRLGLLASRVAVVLEGKHKPTYATHIDTGDHVIVVNAGKIRVTGDKLLAKSYARHSGYPGGLYSTNFTKLQARHPDRVLRLAVKGMLPKGPLGYAMLKKLKYYSGAEHPHSAQQPKPLEI